MKKEYRPMLATLVDTPFDRKDWVYEIKWDGFRLIAVVKNKKVTLYSRNGIDVTKKYAVIAEAFKGSKDAVYDGELVALDDKGRSRFQLLQRALEHKAPLEYVVFDLLFAGTRDLRKLPLLERKTILTEYLPKKAKLVYSTHVAGKGVALFNKAKRQGLEGVIAKDANGRYHSGRRTRDWLKFKAVMEQEVVIVGYTEPRASRKYFGALVLAVRDKKKSRWQYAGHVGTGFDEKALQDIYRKMRPLVSTKKPFKEKIKDEAVTTWIKPKLIGEIQFTEWTTDGQMRHPAFLGLRTDKKAADIIREK